jgi:DNA-binding response OmpR family regulator
MTMHEHPTPAPWQPKPLTIAVLDSDEFLADSLCALLRERGFAASAHYDMAALRQAHAAAPFDAYVIDHLADWQPHSTAIEELIASIRSGPQADAPIFILGNQTAPEQDARLGQLLMRNRLRYLLRPIKLSYLAKRVAEATMDKAGL